jgi:predicted metal-dependent hydrolase
MFGLFGQIRRDSPRRRPAQWPGEGPVKKVVAPQRVKTQEAVMLAGREIIFTLVSSRLARGVRLKISPTGGLEVVVPVRFSLSALPRLLHQKEEWIIKHLDKLESQKKSSANRLHDGAILQLFGEPYTVRFLPTIQKKASVKEGRTFRFNADHAEETGKEILVYSRAVRIGETAALDSAKPEFENFCRKKAKQYFSRRVSEIARIMGVDFGRITVRGQQSRWGSCSRENNLNFNWRLAFYDQKIADYVIYHELAHTVHHDHSSCFYGLLERHCPDYKALRKKLREGHAPL